MPARLRTILRRAVLAVSTLALCFALAPARAVGGEYSWIKPKADESLLLDIAYAGRRWFAVGERGHVLISDDAEHWKQVRVPARVMLTAVDVSETGLGFAVGHDATIIRTRDNGETWDRVHQASDDEGPLLDVVIVDAQRIVAVGAYGLYVESKDAGQTWEDRILEPEEAEQSGEGLGNDQEGLLYDFHLNDIEIADNGRWYIAAEAGNVYRSDDRGETWLRLPSPYEGSFFGVLPLDAERVLVFGLQGRLFLSSDAGNTWARIETNTDATLSSGLRLAGDAALIAGYAGVLLTGVAEGGSPKLVRLKNRPALSAAYLLEGGDVLTVGEGGIHRWSAAVVSVR